MPSVTIKIANAGTPVERSTPSTFGHMWYSLSDGSVDPLSYGLAPKSILALIEKNLKSGNKDFCHVFKNPEKPITSDHISQKQKRIFNVFVKNCGGIVR